MTALMTPGTLPERSRALLNSILQGIPRGTVDAAAFGATGDGSDQTEAIQRAIDFVEENLNKYKAVTLGAGDYEVSGLTLQYASLIGAGPHRTNNSDLTPIQYGTRLIHKVGATSDILTLTQGVGKECVANLAIHGRQNQNRKASKAITAVSSRTVFSVAAGDVPAAPSDVAQFPFYGLCLFFAGDYRLGCGIVQSVNAGTGQITLVSGTDNYATRTGASNLLTTSDRVVFAPRGTWTEVLGTTYTDVCDSTRTGYNGISVEGRNKVLNNLYIQGVHCGVAVQEGVLFYDEIWTNSCAMASMALRKFGAGSDWCTGRTFHQGYHAVDIGQAANPTALDNEPYQTAFCGQWGLPAVSSYADWTSDQHIHGIIDYGCAAPSFGKMFIDKPLKEGFWSLQGINASGVPDSSVYVEVTMARAVGQDQTTPSPITYPSGQRAVIALTGAVGRQFVTSSASVTRWDGGDPADDFDCFSNITADGSPTQNEVFVGSFSTFKGVTAPWAGQRSWKMLAPFGTGDTNIAVALASKRWVGGSDQTDQVRVTDAVVKEFRLSCFNYTLADPEFTIFSATASSTENVLVVGGGDGSRQAATEIAFHTSSSKSTGSGTSRGKIDEDGLTLKPVASVTPGTNGDLVFEATNDTTLTFKYKGSDGVVRSGSVVLS